MNERVERLQAAMAAAEMEWILLVPGPNFLYLTGAALHSSERLNLLAIPADGAPVALAPGLEAPYLAPLGIRIYRWGDEEGAGGALRRLIREQGLDGARVGVEFDRLRYGEAARIRAAASGLELERADDLLGALRRVKDADEIAAIRRAVEVTEKGLAAAIEQIRVGQTEREIAALLQIALLQAGADRMAFGPHVVSGRRTAEPHAGPSGREIQSGDLVMIDCGATVGGYSGDITRCVALGPVPALIEEIHALCVRANAAGRAAAKAGVSGAEVDQAARAVIEAGGYGPYFVHRTGHGLGIEIHEPPYIVAGNSEPLAPGNVFTVEPGIYVPELGGVRVEDDVVITEAGSESLTTFPRELIRIS